MRLLFAAFSVKIKVVECRQAQPVEHRERQIKRYTEPRFTAARCMIAIDRVIASDQHTTAFRAATCQLIYPSHRIFILPVGLFSNRKIVGQVPERCDAFVNIEGANRHQSDAGVKDQTCQAHTANCC
ncbi:hypothetical protein D9M72_594260 [compost metagenome]